MTTDETFTFTAGNIINANDAHVATLRFLVQSSTSKSTLLVLCLHHKD